MTFEQWLQSRLTAHGFACGPIDGKIGPITIKAIRAFEEAHGLRVDGMADILVVKALRAPAGVASPSEQAAIPDRDKTPIFPDPAINNQWPRQNDVSSYYGKVGTSQTSVEIPWDMVLAWDKSTKIRKMTLHSKVAESASRVFEKIRSTYSDKEISDLGIDQFGGSLNVRRMRGGSRYSMHSWGIAIDFDPVRNALRTHAPKARLSHSDAVPFWECWEAEGWLSLGRARDFDWMHIQAARL